VFGPVLPVQSFDDFEQAVTLANETRYGLTSYIYTRDFQTAMRAADALHSGEVYINKIGPEQLQGFHGGYGLSGLGGDDGPHGFERYHRRKTVYLRYEDGG
jgi:lactaldehyde dehydrogenase / glycolaldehyde dehydrogenase